AEPAADHDLDHLLGDGGVAGLAQESGLGEHPNCDHDARQDRAHEPVVDQDAVEEEPGDLAEQLEQEKEGHAEMIGSALTRRLWRYAARFAPVIGANVDLRTLFLVLFHFLDHVFRDRLGHGRNVLLLNWGRRRCRRGPLGVKYVAAQERAQDRHYGAEDHREVRVDGVELARDDADYQDDHVRDQGHRGFAVGEAFDRLAGGASHTVLGAGAVGHGALNDWRSL